MEFNGVTPEQLAKLKEMLPYKWKVQTANKGSCMCVSYVDSRLVQEHLDKVLGAENWADRYHQVGSRLICELSIKVNGEWVSKSDCGSDSSNDAEKGGASDAFKRAAVKWGVGRFLYDIPKVWLKSIEDGTDHRGKTRYAPVDDKGQKLREVTSFIRSSGKDPNFKPGRQAPAQPQAQAQTPKPAQTPAVQAEPEEQPPFADAIIRKPEDVLAALKKQVMAEGKRVFGGVGKAELVGELQTLADAYELGPLQELDAKRAGFLLQALKKRPNGGPAPIAQLDQKRAERHPGAFPLATDDQKESILFEAHQQGMDIKAAQMWLEGYGYKWETLSVSQADHALTMLADSARCMAEGADHALALQAEKIAQDAVKKPAKKQAQTGKIKTHGPDKYDHVVMQTLDFEMDMAGGY